MGSALSKSNNKQEPSKQFVNHRINSSYPVAIQHWLFNHFHCMEIPPHPDIIDLCLQFVGYLMDSHICSVSDTCILYNLMLSDHQHRRFVSPFINNGTLPCYFELVYRVSGHFINNFLLYFKTYCMNIPNLLIVFQTEFDHVFAFYAHTPIKKRNANSFFREYNTVDPLDSGLYLIKSNFNYECNELKGKHNPRTIGVRAKLFKGDALMVCGTNIYFADLYMQFRNTSNDKGHFCNMSHPSNQQYDTIGNELLGGDVLKLDSSAEFISLKRIEVFHILSTLT
eukprot:36513_1